MASREESPIARSPTPSRAGSAEEMVTPGEVPKLGGGGGAGPATRSPVVLGGRNSGINPVGFFPLEKLVVEAPAKAK